MPPVFCYKGARRAVLAVGKDNRQERKLRPRAEKRDSAFPRERIKPQLSISVISQGKDFHALWKSCVAWRSPARVCWLPLKEREETPSLFLIKPQNAPFGWARFRHSINVCRFPYSGQQSLRVRNTEMGFLCREPRDEMILLDVVFLT